jgi:hypothetical protein
MYYILSGSNISIGCVIVTSQDNYRGVSWGRTTVTNYNNSERILK